MYVDIRAKVMGSSNRSVIMREGLLEGGVSQFDSLQPF